jgi:uncharacterized cupredoxin-like copper-binding protein
MRVRRALYPAAAAALLGLAGCGSDQKSSATTEGSSGRVIEVAMSDNAYSPKQIQVRKGETVTFRFTNKGTQRHEALVAPEAEQIAHDAEMAAMAAGTPTTAEPAAPAADPVPADTPTTAADAGGAAGGLGAEMPPMPGMDHGNGSGGAPTTADDGDDHAHGGMSHDGSGNAVTVEPGKTGELTYTFSDDAAVVIGCHEPGHWTSGMKATVLYS